MARIHIEVPDDVHRRAKAVAALRGVSLKDFVIEAIERASDDHRDTPAASAKKGKGS